MDAYLKVVRDLAKEFEFFELVKVPRGENVCADALAALGSKLRDQVQRTILIHNIEKPSIDTLYEAASTKTDLVLVIQQADQTTPEWRTEFIDFLTNGKLPAEKWNAKRLKARSANYVVLEGSLHRLTANKTILRCLNGEETYLVMAKSHEGARGKQSGGRALGLKVKSLGSYWPTIISDCESYARRCDKFHRQGSTIHCPT